MTFQEESGTKQRAILFLTFFVLVLLLINILYIGLVLSKKNVYRKEVIYDKTFQSGIQLDYAFFGDSHVYYAIYPEFINNSFNFGTNQENYVKTYYKLRRAIKEGIEIKTVVLQIDPHTFSTFSMNEDFLLNELPIYSKSMSFKEIHVLSKKSYPQIFLEVFFPVLGNGKDFGIIFSEWFGKYESPEIILGGVKSYTNFSDLGLEEREVMAKERLETFYLNQTISKLSQTYFLQTIVLAENNDIEIILITYPHSKEFIDKDPYPEIDSLGFTYFDFYSFYENNTEYFTDSDHLNYLGAEKFSRMLNDAL